MKPMRFAVGALRLWIGLTIVSMTVCVVLVITLFNMAPRIQILPQMFTKDVMSANQFLEATAINPMVPIKERKLIDEMFVRFYVENRYFYVPDIPELSYRYGGRGPIARLSAPPVYARFVKSKGNYLENVQNNKGTVSVDIWRVAPWRGSNNLYSVDFDVYRFEDGRQAYAGTKRATIKIGHNPRFIGWRQDFANPYGFFVMSYDETSLKKR